MPEYLAPGVYVEETSYRSKSIEGVSTTTTGFVGPARFGPVDLEPDIITSLGEFERIYGDGRQLEFGNGNEEMDNYLWHAARAFFTEGGQRLYISRVFNPGDPPADAPPVGDAPPAGYAWQTVPRSLAKDASDALWLRARFPGSAGNLRVRFTLRLGQNIFTVGKDANGSDQAKVPGLLDDDIVYLSDADSPPHAAFYRAQSKLDDVTKQRLWTFKGAGAPDVALDHLPHDGTAVRIVTATVTVMLGDEDQTLGVWDGLALDPDHERAGAEDSLFAKFGSNPGSLRVNSSEPMVSLPQARILPVVIRRGASIKTGLDVLQAFFSGSTSLQTRLIDDKSSDLDRSLEIQLKEGHDGVRPKSHDYEGEERILGPGLASVKTGLMTFEDVEDISIVAAPGSTHNFENGYRTDASSITNLLIAHASKMRYRIAVLDCAERQDVAAVRAMRAKIDSTYAAFYYPWVRILDPITGKENYMPPSGFVAGIYCRNDVQRAVYKAPANEVVNLAIGFEQLLNKAQQDVLNPEGINCFRFFEGRGFRLWGARTSSSDPEWKYVNLRRYFAYLERSIDKGTQWAVFEPNGDKLWGNVRRTIEDFLLNEWMMGALLGEKPEKAFFVRCDRTTMSQNDLDNGRLVCLIGVAPLRPAEFVIFRIGQWTSDRKV